MVDCRVMHWPSDRMQCSDLICPGFKAYTSIVMFVQHTFNAHSIGITKEALALKNCGLRR